MIEYEDFSLKIEPKRGDVYPVIVLRSPAGEGRSSFQLPFDPDEIGDILFDLGRTVRGSSQSPLRDVSPAATRTPPQKVGDQLFNALFSGPVRSLLDRSLGMIHGSQSGLCIKLHIDPEDSDLARLASLPWELLYRKETRDWLNLSQFTPIVRYLDVQRAYTPLPLELPLRILVVISKPSGYVQLDLKRERALIEQSWAKQRDVQVEFMEQATILALQDRLAEQRYHVLHYMGHGDFDERTGRGVLLMEDDYGQGDKVDGRTLGILLRDVRTLRLVFLNACETAKVAREKGLDPFAGVASAMVMAGIPAVVAMQFPISDDAAITFARRFYPLLARGYPADAAVAEGRRAIRLAEPDTMEWCTPVLFMRAPQGVIFRVSGARPAKAPVPTMPELPPEADEELEQRLGQLYTDGLGAFWLEDWERACRSFQAIVNVRPDYQEAALKLQHAERQRKLHALYDQARAAQEAQDWKGALSALEELVAEDAKFEDAAALLQTVKKQKRLADLYAEARQLYNARQWQAVINVFSQIAAVEPDYPDPEELLPTAEQEIVEQKRQAKLKDLYNSALRELNAQRLPEARDLLIQIREIEPEYGDTERLLAKVEAEIAKEEEQHRREEADRQQQEQITTLYKQALELAQVKKWRQALSKMDEIQALDPQFADPEGIAARAQGGLKREEDEEQRQSELVALYAEAVRLLQAGQYQEALDKWNQVYARDSNYPDRQRVEANARKKLAALTEPARPKRSSREWVAERWQAVVRLPSQRETKVAVAEEPRELAEAPSKKRSLPRWAIVVIAVLVLTLAGGSLWVLYSYWTRSIIVEGVAFSPDGTILAASGRAEVRLWQVSDGRPLRTLAWENVLIRALKETTGSSHSIWSIAFSPNGTILAAGRWDGPVGLWQVSDGRLLHTLEGHTHIVESVDFSPDGTMLASGSSDTVRLWQVSDGTLLRTLEGHTDGVESVAFSPDGAMLASGSEDETVRLWQVSDGTLLRILEGHTDWVKSVAFSPDGAMLASGSIDKTVRLWQVSDGTLLRTLEGHTGWVESVAFSPDGAMLASGSWDNTARLWQVSDGTLLHTYKLR